VNGPEHYAQAEALLERLNDSPPSDPTKALTLATRANAHAALAGVALDASRALMGPMDLAAAEAWAEVVR
jgi:hypothetical protein